MIVGILGGGQLGRMLALAGYPLGLRFRCFDPEGSVCVDGLVERVRGAWDDRAALSRFAEGLDVVTYEFENVPVDTVRILESLGVEVLPPARALEVSQDRLAEKQFFAAHGVATAPFAAVDSEPGLRDAVAMIGLPAVLKTRRGGYDGKGQIVIRAQDEVAVAWAQLGDVPLILEGFVPFERELSIVAARDRGGHVACYPLVQNVHRDGILRLTFVPAPEVRAELQAEAEHAARRILDALDYVGVAAIELFERDGALVANEMAPRVHNSGHWTIDGAVTSQFENHVRAVAGLPLGPTVLRGASLMVNVIGSTPDLPRVALVPGAHIHMYDKAPRPGRKIGHVTLNAEDSSTLAARLPDLAAAMGFATAEAREADRVLRHR
jgi:5-(carboxyamino)imidazole ribonucleotide synthase